MDTRPTRYVLSDVFGRISPFFPDLPPLRPSLAPNSIDLCNSLNTLAVAAGLIQAGKHSIPSRGRRKLHVGALRIFEDVGVTACSAAAPLIQSKTYLAAAAGILAVEAYHAGNIRTVLFDEGQVPPRQQSGGSRSTSGADDHQGVVMNGVANITPTDVNALTFPLPRRHRRSWAIISYPAQKCSAFLGSQLVAEDARDGGV